MKIVQYIVIIWLVIGCIQRPDNSIEHVKEETISLDTLKPTAPMSLQIDYDTTQWVEILNQPIVRLDLRYATTENFTNQILYPCARCFLRPEVAKAILRAAETLQKEGFSLKLFDCYRPLEIQRALWKHKPNPSYVTPPSKGSMHNKGLAVDLTLASLQGHPIDMGTPYDYFGPAAHSDYMELDSTILARRKILRKTMKSVGLNGIRTEWWHYSMSSLKAAIQDSIWNCPDVL